MKVACHFSFAPRNIEVHSVCIFLCGHCNGVQVLLYTVFGVLIFIVASTKKNCEAAFEHF